MRIPVFAANWHNPIYLLPVVSVTFILVLLLCSTGLMIRGEFSESVELPQSAHAVAAPRSAARPRIVVNVESDGRFYVAGRYINAHELEAVFREEQSKRPATVEVLIRADRAATYGSVTPVLLAAIHSDVRIINIAVRQESGHEAEMKLGGVGLK